MAEKGELASGPPLTTSTSLSMSFRSSRSSSAARSSWYSASPTPPLDVRGEGDTGDEEGDEEEDEEEPWTAVEEVEGVDVLLVVAKSSFTFECELSSRPMMPIPLRRSFRLGAERDLLLLERGEVGGEFWGEQHAEDDVDAADDDDEEEEEGAPTEEGEQGIDDDEEERGLDREERELWAEMARGRGEKEEEDKEWSRPFSWDEEDDLELEKLNFSRLMLDQATERDAQSFKKGLCIELEVLSEESHRRS